MLSVFISYARENRAQAASLAEALEQKGFKVWWDRDLVAGERFRETIRVQLEQAQRVIVLWSKASVTSDFVIDEAGEADKSRKLVPISIDGTNPPLGFRNIHTLFLEPPTRSVGEIVYALYKQVPLPQRRRSSPLQVIVICSIVVALGLGAGFLTTLVYQHGLPQLGSFVGGSSRSVIDLSLGNTYKEGNNSPDATEWIKYDLTSERGKRSITATSPYLDGLRAREVRRPVSFFRTLFKWEPLTLDFKILNTSSETQLFTAVEFRVRSSTIDPTPIPMIQSGVKSRFQIVNDGWGPMNECRADFDLRVDGLPGEQASRYLAQKERFDHSSFCEVDRGGASYIDISAAARATDTAKFKDDRAWVAGVLRYSFRDVAGRPVEERIPFVVSVYLKDRLLIGMPLRPSFTYDASLRSEGRDYSVSVPISHSLKPGETDRFLVRVSVDKSSIHDLSIILRYNNKEVSVGDTEIKFLMPRSLAAYVRQPERKGSTPEKR